MNGTWGHLFVKQGARDRNGVVVPTMESWPLLFVVLGSVRPSEAAVSHFRSKCQLKACWI